MIKRIKKVVGYLILIVVLLAIPWQLSLKPSNDKNWRADQQVLAYADINDNLIHVHNIRNFSYKSEEEFTPGYYNKTYDLNKLEKVYFIMERFSNFQGQAHTFVSFEFSSSAESYGGSASGGEDSDFLAITVEARREVGETWDPFRGVLRQFELMYVIADEQDVVKLRTNYRNDPLYIFPIKTTKEKSQAMFLEMIKRANKLKEKPEFYHTVSSSCTTNLVKHVNTISPEKLPDFSLSFLLPG